MPTIKHSANIAHAHADWVKIKIREVMEMPIPIKIMAWPIFLEKSAISSSFMFSL